MDTNWKDEYIRLLDSVEQLLKNIKNRRVHSLAAVAVVESAIKHGRNLEASQPAVEADKIAVGGVCNHCYSKPCACEVRTYGRCKH